MEITNVIDWAGGNDYCIGKIDRKERFYIERHGAKWLAVDWEGASNDVIASGAFMSETQEKVEALYAAERRDAGT